jgi:hypothetical protein
MSEKGMSAGKIVGITCGSLFGVFVVLPLLAMFLPFLGFGLEQLIFPLLIAGLVIFLVRRNNKLRGGVVVATPKVAARVAAPQTNSQPAQMGGDIPTTVCQHSFSAADLAGRATITCPCGYKFKTKDLLDYQKLSADYLRIEQDLIAVRQKLIAATTSSAPVAARQAVPAAPVVRKVRKARASLSLQQWLIMGASAIIMIAVTRAAMRIRFLVPTTFSAHIIATMMAISKKRGCIKVARANQPPT